jgi:hypothetical protein
LNDEWRESDAKKISLSPMDSDSDDAAVKRSELAQSLLSAIICMRISLFNWLFQFSFNSSFQMAK